MIKDYLSNIIPYILSSIPIILTIRIFLFLNMKKNKKYTTTLHELGLFFFLITLVGLASQTIIPKQNIFSNFIYRGEINLIPFKSFVDYYNKIFIDKNINYFIINFFGNIVWFIPIGLLIPLLFNNISFKYVTLINFFISLFIEICQLPQERTTDIDDIILNTLGGVLGYLIWTIINKYFKDYCKKFKVKEL